jgi:hypothetical protein
MTDQQEAYGTYLRLVAECKKEVLNKRIDLFKMILDSELFKYDDFRRGYEKNVHVRYQNYIEISRN